MIVGSVEYWGLAGCWGQSPLNRARPLTLEVPRDFPRSRRLFWEIVLDQRNLIWTQAKKVANILPNVVVSAAAVDCLPPLGSDGIGWSRKCTFQRQTFWFDDAKRQCSKKSPGFQRLCLSIETCLNLGPEWNWYDWIYVTFTFTLGSVMSIPWKITLTWKPEGLVYGR